MKFELNMKERRDLAKIIRSELEFTNGWRVSDDTYEEYSERAAKRILSLLKRRKRLSPDH